MKCWQVTVTICQLTYHPCVDTQFRHSQTTQQYFRAVAMSSRKKRKQSSCFCPNIVVGKEIALTRIGVTNMLLVTKGLMISSTRLSKDRISRRWQLMVSSNHIKLLSKVRLHGSGNDEVNKSEEFDGKHYFVGSFCFTAVSGVSTIPSLARSASHVIPGGICTGYLFPLFVSL